MKSRLHRARVAVRAAVAPLLGDASASPSPTCPDVVDALSRHLEGDIAAADCAAMEQHVLGCVACRARCDALRTTLSMCRASAVGGEVPPHVQRAVRAALRRALAAA
ncbi:MAG: zf-HC2 domain-containing protein [Polyangiaceae bacterium]